MNTDPIILLFCTTENCQPHQPFWSYYYLQLLEVYSYLILLPLRYSLNSLEDLFFIHSCSFKREFPKILSTVSIFFCSLYFPWIVLFRPMAVISLIQTHSKSILLGSHSLLDTRLLCLTAPWTSVLGYSQHLKLSMPKSVYVVFSSHSLFINLNIKKCFLIFFLL